MCMKSGVPKKPRKGNCNETSMPWNTYTNTTTTSTYTIDTTAATNTATFPIWTGGTGTGGF